MENNLFSRREALKLAGLAGLTLSVPSLARPAFGQTAAPKPQPFAGIYRTKVGDWTATIISDGQAEFPPKPFFAPEASPAQVEGYLKSRCLRTDQLRLDHNILLLEDENRKILVDTGSGGDWQLKPRLAALGITPAEITHIVVSHAHPDHIGGTLDAADKPAFPNAKIFITGLEQEYWTKNPDLSKTLIPEDWKPGLIAKAQTFLTVHKDRIEIVKSGQTIEGVLEAIAAPGHTPGHTVFLIGSGTDRLLHIADTAHHTLLAENPQWSIGFDADAAQGIRSRTKLLDDAARSSTRLLAYHLPFPGFGHVRKTDDGFQWLPEPMVLS